MPALTTYLTEELYVALLQTPKIVVGGREVVLSGSGNVRLGQIIRAVLLNGK